MRILAIGLCLPFAVACAQPVSPSPLASPTPRSATEAVGPIGGAGDNGVAVPFTGTFDGLLTVSVPLPFPLLSNLIEGSGTAAHLGQFTLRMPHVVDRLTRMGTGTYEFAAANGDRVIADFSGQATVIGPGILSSADAAVIRGGTGRFLGVTGTLTAERTFIMATGEVTGSFTGTMTFWK